MRGQTGVHEQKVTEANSVLIETFMVHRAALARFIALRCGSDNADDLVQELWIKIQQVDASVDQPLAYLYRAAHRLVLDTRRGASRSRDREQAWSLASGQFEGAETPIAERRLLAAEQLRRVEEALASVGSRATRIFTRYRVDGIEQRRIAAEMGVSLSTVEKDLRRSYAAISGLKDERNEA
ncbi:RNA polymerase sigma factor [Sphingomonas abietis]|uniref:RNA polymerase sigma factor n=1 Tax=Sphingomonas abietis TaxID=3012344 RepID=A0ABY7NP81_9SPHN|nr:RNA polymerase sigma factor [Sphingomonas abietis]WBO21734.1 RNA polymerase sigma factor [Sphingomonas abietis]